MSHDLALPTEALNQAKGYAKALFDIATEKAILASVYESLLQLHAIFQDAPEALRVFLSNEEISGQALEEALSPFLEQADAWVVKTLKLMFKQEHYAGIPALYEAFLPLYEASQKIGHIHVRSAVDLNTALRQEIEERLGAIFGLSQVVLHHKVDAEILGGLYVEYKGLRFDATLKRQLARFEEALSQV
ncbi:MAG: ATP synthase F1 subunit delta [Vampirovibrionales bacterium]